MKIIRTASEMQSWALHKRAKGLSIGFVPTMGALHLGHQSLVDQARGENDLVVVSIYVNPLQFGPNEDFKRYPRTEKSDLALLEKAQADVVFIPSTAEMAGPGFQTSVRVAKVAAHWEAASRPGHFDGVATIVAKLFQIVQPTRAYFGQKDVQQLRLIQRMVSDLSIPVDVIPCTTVREADGLAFSSRNRYLSASERDEAVKIYQALFLGRELIEERIMLDAPTLVNRLTQVLTTIPKGQIDYLGVVDPITLEPMKKIKRPTLLIAAVYVGKTRLIDNLFIP